MRYVIRNEEIRRLVHTELDRLDLNQPWLVRVNPWVAPRSLEQNAFLHAVPLRIICDHTGHDIDEIKEYLLIEAFGSQEKEVLGRRIVRPIKRSSELTTQEFSWFLDWIEHWAIETVGLVIPRPNETIT